LENAQSMYSLFSKLGDALKTIEINQFHSKVDYNYYGSMNEGVKFDYPKIRVDREIKNAFNKSIYWRSIYITSMRQEANDASEIIVLIDEILKR